MKLLPELKIKFSAIVLREYHYSGKLDDFTVQIKKFLYIYLGFPGSSAVKESACQHRRLRFTGLIPGSKGEGNGNPLQYSCLENPMDRGAWQASVHGVTKSWT